MKLMENQDSMTVRYYRRYVWPGNRRVMLAHYFVVMREKINLDELYTASGDYKYYDTILT